MDSTKQILAVIFDWGNVLGRFDPDKAFSKLAKYCRYADAEISVILSDLTLKEKTERGFMTEEELFEEVTSALSLRGIQFQIFRHIWGDIMSPCLGVEKVIRRIRPDVKKFVLSNTESIHWSYIEQLSVMREFFSDPVLLIRSYTVGHRKPEKNIFMEGIRRADLPAEDILYVDDIREHTAVFDGLGGSTLVYDCSKDPLSRLEQGLASHGLLD